MSHVRERFCRVLARPTGTLAANVFDPLSACIAHMLGYEVCVLSGSVGKGAAPARYFLDGARFSWLPG